ncbi:hypothetical protein N657DRAFT_632618 [Parathielavia appendiculata]|uniref:Monopolin complex subunit Csm1/Pcs1 C-terminal domain-containing protein n=1 Tax=Parathielavia appendiculata TaxID=2587402 RepID=A0AAN6U528_9PEZI|nr:hypothetical protein N657DRAFT_632618 [Parathielavia appendiculata]
MSKAKVRSHLLQLVDSDSEDGIGGTSLGVTVAQHSKPTRANSTMPPKKARVGRQAANRVTKPAPKTSTSKARSSDRIAAAVDEVTTRKQSASKTTGASAKDSGRGGGRKPVAAAVEEVEDTVMTEAPKAAIETPPAAKQKGHRGRPKKVVVEAETQPSGARRGRKAVEKRPEPDTTVEEMVEIPETQQPDAAQSDVDDSHDDLEDLPVSQSPGRAKVGCGGGSVSASKRPLHTSSPDKGDPTLRRRLGEMTQKYESLEHKYRDLKEIAVKEAERNFDKLKKQTEDKSKAAEELIATLKSELAAQKEFSKEIQRLRKELEASESKADNLQTKLTSLTTSLNEYKSEIKSLNLKLSAARSAEAAAAAAATAKVPGSAINGGSGAAAAHRLAAATASEATLAAQKKEDLYGDLTGLIVRSVKREGGEDVFDCIQTGRNGNVSPDEGGGEAHCHYTPQLEANRDRALIAVLPDFLVDEISFPQAQAGRFYARVLKALNEPADGGASA